MAARTYLNFDLSIELDDEGGIKVNVLESPAGEAHEQHEWPFSDQDLEIFLLRVGHTRRGVRRVDSPEMEAARDFGEELYDSVFSGQIGTSFERSIDEADRQGQGLRVRIRTEEPELSDVPWEFLYSTPLHRFLTVSTATPLVRYIEQPRMIAPLAVDEAVRILTMVSSPTDVAELDVEAEWARINESLSELESRGQIEIKRLEEATLAALMHELRQQTYHVFHFIGHGAFDAGSDEGVLMFEDDRGRGHKVSGEHLGTILADHNSLRLVVLNSCEGARAGSQDPFGGTAQGLVRQGIPAVIGMQFEITDEAALTFSRDFYSAIADGYPVDAALAEARKAIYSGGNDVEWGTPVLHMRSPDGRIFERPEGIRPLKGGVSESRDVIREEDISPRAGPIEQQGRQPEAAERARTVPAPSVPVPSDDRNEATKGLYVVVALLALMSVGTVMYLSAEEDSGFDGMFLFTSLAFGWAFAAVGLSNLRKPSPNGAALWIAFALYVFFGVGAFVGMTAYWQSVDGTFYPGTLVTLFLVLGIAGAMAYSIVMMTRNTPPLARGWTDGDATKRD